MIKQWISGDGELSVVDYRFSVEEEQAFINSSAFHLSAKR